MEIIKIGESKIAFSNHSSCTSEYYKYCIKLFIQVLLRKNISLNFIFYSFHDIAEIQNPFDDNNPIIRIVYQYEHTLVKKNGRSINADTKPGKIFIEDEPSDCSPDVYLVRLVDAPVLFDFDIIIEYSFLNMINYETSDLFQQFYKFLHISPLIYGNLQIDSTTSRQIDVLTTFINIHEPRRNKLLIDMYNAKINYMNVNDCFEPEYSYDSWNRDSNRKIVKLYSNTKILINIHQTDSHHTLEELRILPALATKTLIICENVPLKDKIPYHEHIIWTDYKNVIPTVLEVSSNYEYYFNKIFNDKLTEILNNIHNNNIQNIERYIDNLSK